jgi:hypothetical protein
MTTLARLQMVQAAYQWEQDIIDLWASDIVNALPVPPANPVAACFAEIWKQYFLEVKTSNAKILGIINSGTLTTNDKADQINNVEHKHSSVKHIKICTNGHRGAAYFNQFDNLVCLELAARNIIEEYLDSGVANCNLKARCADLVSIRRKAKRTKGRASGAKRGKK